MYGRAYVFLRKDGAPLPGGHAGHIGWGVRLAPGGPYFCGSTENQSGHPWVPPGGDNGWWGQEAATEEAMVQLFKERSYDAYKWATVRTCDAAAARQEAERQQGAGYAGLRNNCLDHSYQVLEAYGLKDLPWLQTHPAPSDWFAQFNGEYRNIDHEA